MSPAPATEAALLRQDRSSTAAFPLTLSNYSQMQTLVIRGGRRNSASQHHRQRSWWVGTEGQLGHCSPSRKAAPLSSNLIPPASSWKLRCLQMALQESAASPWAGSDPVQLVTPSCPRIPAAILPTAALTDLFKIAVTCFLNAHYNSYPTA